MPAESGSCSSGTASGAAASAPIPPSSDAASCSTRSRHEVLGVMPASFAHPSDAEFWLPMAPVGQFESLFTSRGVVLADRRGPPQTRRQRRGRAGRDGRDRGAVGTGVSVECGPRGPSGVDARGNRRRREAAAVDPAGRGVFRIAHRLRQRGEPAHDARRLASARAGDPNRARRRQGAIEPSTADRKPGAGADRRSGRARARGVGHGGLAIAGAAGVASARRRGG